MMTMNGDQDPAFYTSSPYLRATKSAVDTALANERDRIKHLEAQEATFSTVEELKAALKKERQHSKHIVGELAALKSVAVASTLEAEVCEEGRINCLMRRLDILQKEKGRIIVELEREEEMLTNTLQKKLNEVRREKAELEKQIEREHMLKVKLETMSEGQLSASTQTDDASTTCSMDTANTTASSSTVCDSSMK
jgi:hypothetical protein